ncbi:hypothetical protein [Apilactobacillus micheneri]|uniref:hypothetical protein n=1 Tax=Apilactobacillus micheneri TaxID=1899430 RepID=UPI000D03659A|nr:hypothetical protein [Apilactobacillus micheneri]
MGPAVIAAGVNGIFAFYFNKQRISSDIKAKSRIEWIQSVRNISSDIMYDSSDYVSLNDSSIYDLPITDDFTRIGFSNDDASKIMSNTAKLLLYFADTNKKTNQVVLKDLVLVS